MPATLMRKLRAGFALRHDGTARPGAFHLLRPRPSTSPLSIKWRLLLPGASGPRRTELNPPGLQIGISDCVTQPEQPEHSCRLQLWFWPDNAGTIPGKSAPFTPSSILVRPRRNPCIAMQSGGLGWSRRVLPPGPKGLLRRPFIAISGLRRHLEYRRGRLTK